MPDGWVKIAALAVLAILYGAGVEAQEPKPEDRAIRRFLAGFKADEWKVRAGAFYDLISLGEGDRSYVAAGVTNVLDKYPDEADSVRMALIRLLERENSKVHEHVRKGEKMGEYSDYYADVIVAVTTLKDLRSMDALLGAITTGAMAIHTLAQFAPISLDPVLRKLDDPDRLVRMSALDVLAQMLVPPNRENVKDPEHRAKIKQAFVRSLSDEKPVVRQAAVDGLARLGEPDVIPLLEKIAEHDPAFFPGQADGGKDLYYVRRAAKRALQQLRAQARQQD